MDHARNKIIFCLFLLILSACSSRTPEEQLLRQLEEKYANLYFNNEAHKRKVIDELREYLKTHELNDDHINDIHHLLNRINDGHVVLFDERADKNQKFSNGIKFVVGSDLVESCPDCTPALAKDKYEILDVNNKPFKDFLMQNKYEVAASTDWGRYFRLTRLLKEKNNNEATVLKLKNTSGKIITTNLNWKPVSDKPLVCVSGERLAPDVYKVSVTSLWCDDSKGSWSREQVYDNFKNQFDGALSNANQNDRLIMELRENGGGGDEEVEYILNAFHEKPVFFYHFKYLRKTHPGKRKWFEKFWPFKLSLWADDEYEYTDTKYRPKKTFYKNKMATIISSGCFSSCETIASILKNEKRSIVIGSTTHGGSGDPVIFPIKGTPYSINIPTCVNWQEPGLVYEGVGVQPNIAMEQNPKIKEDNILKSAIDLTR
jgi:C-terminal processing protease CtpA/Prc